MVRRRRGFLQTGTSLHSSPCPSPAKVWPIPLYRYFFNSSHCSPRGHHSILNACRPLLLPPPNPGSTPDCAFQNVIQIMSFPGLKLSHYFLSPSEQNLYYYSWTTGLPKRFRLHTAISVFLLTLFPPRPPPLSSSKTSHSLPIGTLTVGGFVPPEPLWAASFTSLRPQLKDQTPQR